MKLVCVTWRDISSEHLWQTKDEAIKWAREAYNEECKTYGFILKETKEYIVIASTTATDDSYNDIVMIMKSVIKKIEDAS